MAKKKTEQEFDDQESIDYENVEPEAVEFEIPEDWQPISGEATELVTETITLPDERVSFALPYGVLVALIDQDHDEADTLQADQLGLINSIETIYSPAGLTELGKLVLDGFDQTAVRHKMLAAWRAAQNAAIDSDKTGFKRA